MVTVLSYNFQPHRPCSAFFSMIEHKRVESLKVPSRNRAKHWTHGTKLQHFSLSVLNLFFPLHFTGHSWGNLFKTAGIQEKTVEEFFN